MAKDGNSLEELGRAAQGTVGGRTYPVFPGRLRMLGEEEAQNGRPYGDPAISTVVASAATDALVEAYSASIDVSDSGNSDGDDPDDLHNGRS